MLMLPSFARLLALALLLLIAACRAETAPADSNACQQTYEFTNTGCLEVTGHVVGLRKQPLWGIVVGAHFPSDRDLFNGGYFTTHVAGEFTLRAARMFGHPPLTGPDTVSLWIVAADPSSAGLDGRVTIRDSVLVQATISAVGEIPTPTYVTLTLPVP